MGMQMTRQDRRFQRQFDALERLVPRLRAPLAALRRDAWRPLRLPLAVILIAGGVFSVLPFLGIWMLPLGLLLLAIDLPVLRGPLSALMIRARRRLHRWQAARRG
jgi:hypothetical protein